MPHGCGLVGCWRLAEDELRAEEGFFVLHGFSSYKILRNLCVTALLQAFKFSFGISEINIDFSATIERLANWLGLIASKALFGLCDKVALPLVSAQVKRGRLAIIRLLTEVLSNAFRGIL